jgi:Na+-transporting NADH:ubiquinone oxidoreductase subunit D
MLSFVDGIGNGLGYSFILIVVAFMRELFGAGKLFGYSILKTIPEGGSYYSNGLLVLPPSAFFLIAMIIWLIRSIKKEQVEKA